MLPEQGHPWPAARSRQRCSTIQRLSAALLLTAAASAHAQSDDDAELAALLDVLAEETEIATKSKQNADYVPGIVSVLHAGEMQAIGARTVLDALATVPGIEVNRDDRGAATLRVRAAEFFFNGGNVKVLVDSLAISREAAFQNSVVLLMPLEQVDRIEVIRGPGAGVHGDFAFVGLVNIITKRDRNAVAAGAGSGDRTSAVWNFSHTTDGGAHIGGSVSDWRSDRYDGPEPQPADERRNHATFAFDYGRFGVKAAAVDRDYLRIAPPSLPPQPGMPQPPLQRFEQRESNSVVEARYRWERDPDHRAAVWLTYQNTDFERERTLFRGHRTELGADASWRFGIHLLYAQALYAQPAIDDAVSVGRATQAFSGLTDQRDYTALAVQDQIALGDAFTVTAGLRYDDLEGIDSLLSKQLALLWRIDDRHALKAQYAEGFRSPHYIEMFAANGPPASGIPFETIDTAEVAYVYRAAQTVFRATAFRSWIDDLIFPRDTPLATRDLAIELKGVELEASRQLLPWLKVMATVSQVESKDQRRTPNASPVNIDLNATGDPDWLGNVALIARAGESWTFGMHWNHVGERSSPRGRVDGYDQLNLGATWRTPLDGVQLRLGVRNALEDDVNYVVALTPNTGTTFDYGARLWSAEVVWEW